MGAVRCWIADSLTRVYPQTRPQSTKSLRLVVARGERLSATVGVRHCGDAAASIAVVAEPASGIRVRVRRVGYVPVAHANTATPRAEREGDFPGFCPDPLYDENEMCLGPDETGSFWLTVEVTRRCRVGTRAVRVIVSCAGQVVARLRLVLDVRPVVVGRLRGFPVSHWFYADAILDWYGLQPWERRFWDLLPAFFQNLVEHRQDTVYVPVFTPPLDGVKRPSQLLKVTPSGSGEYRFDWRHVRRWITLAREAGIRNFEWCHPFTQWGAKYGIRVYAGPNGDGALLWPPTTRATSQTYRGFLSAYLPALHRFIEREGIGRRSFFHVSDEPHSEADLKNYRKAREMLRELAPWMQVMDALSDVRYGLEGLTDTPVPTIRTALDFRRAGIPSWCYFCCGPRGRYLNRLLDTPLAKIRMAGWLFHRFEMQGFLHWGYNYWQKSQTSQLIDPFTEQSGAAWPGWAYGDPFVVYPGPAGPLDSVRWEVWAESLQDMALLQAAGVAADGALLQPLRSFAQFPKSSAWIRRARARILRSA